PMREIVDSSRCAAESRSVVMSATDSAERTRLAGSLPRATWTRTTSSPRWSRPASRWRRDAQPQVSKSVEITGRRHQPDSAHPDDEPQIEWTFIDDGRTGVATRRDHARPINWFEGKTVELWGCG